MKKSFFLTMAVFVITLFCSQLVCGQYWVVCNNDDWRERNIYVSAPNFSIDFQAVISTPDGEAYAEARWTEPNGKPRKPSMYCPWNCGFKNIGTQLGGGINVYIHCWSAGSDSYSKAEVWW